MGRFQLNSRQCLWILAALVHSAGTTVRGVHAVEAGPLEEEHKVGQERKIPLTETSPIHLRCVGTKGKWCEDFLLQEPVTWKTAPRGDKECPDNCNNVGRCNHDTGYCDCPAGWTGEGCRKRQKRPCTNVNRSPEDPSKEPASHIGPDKRDKDWTEMGITYSRCGGICDDDFGICYCDGPLGRIPTPDDAPAGTPPKRRGRPLVTHHMAPVTTWDGRRAFGEQPYENVYGPLGYCNATQPVWSAACAIDDLGGPTCDDPMEAFCPAACSGHGTCNLGFCVCDEGYYGHDCARRRAGLPQLPSRIPTTRWLADVVVDPPAAREPPPKAVRRRPLVYVYDLEPMYQAKILQYRVSATWCVHRRHDHPHNQTIWTDVWVYAMETLLHELFLLSEHRTFDPEEADFFYVPHQASCLPFPIGSWADHPWFPGPGGPRVAQMANMMMETVQWINATYPFWQRRGGRDHIWVFTHDEGACWAPNVLTPSIWLTHWGRMDKDHKSNTAFRPDRYDEDFKSPHQPEGYLKHTKGHVCYDPAKDLVIPSFKSPRHYEKSSLQGAPARERDLLFFFRGDVGKHRLPNYSRGVRQKIYKLAQKGDWANNHKFYIGDRDDVKGDYSDLISRAKFCLVAAGDGWSSRLEDAVTHGCIPVIIFDEVHAVLESIVDFESFSVRIKEADVDRILEILQAIPERQVRAKQAHLGQVWHRFRYGSLPGLARELQGNSDRYQPYRSREEKAGQVHFPRPFKGDPVVDDAFGTIVQWLYSRIPHTR